MNIRTACIETDLLGIVRLINACDPDHPTTLDSLRPNFLDATPGRVQRRLVAVDEKEAVKGYSVVIQVAEAPAHHFYVWLGVDLSLRGQRIGSALWNISLEYLQTQGADGTNRQRFAQCTHPGDQPQDGLPAPARYLPARLLAGRN